jgi:hypothetical protein
VPAAATAKVAAKTRKNFMVLQLSKGDNDTRSSSWFSFYTLISTLNPNTDLGLSDLALSIVSQ